MSLEKTMPHWASFLLCMSINFTIGEDATFFSNTDEDDTNWPIQTDIKLVFLSRPTSLSLEKTMPHKASFLLYLPINFTIGEDATFFLNTDEDDTNLPIQTVWA